MNNDRFRQSSKKVYSTPVSCAAAATQSVVAAIPAVAGGPGTGLPGTPAQTVAVIGFMLTCDTAHGTAQFLSSTGSVALTGAMLMPVDGNLSLGQQPDPAFQTAPGDALQLAAVTGAIHGWVNYILL